MPLVILAVIYLRSLFLLFAIASPTNETEAGKLVMTANSYCSGPHGYQTTAMYRIHKSREYFPNNLQHVYSIIAAGIRDIILWDAVPYTIVFKIAKREVGARLSF